MANAGIILVGKQEGKLVPMEETPCVTKDDLQVLLADYPDLLPGDQIAPENPRRWLLVSREMPVPGGDDEAGRWSLDHLFLDQDGIPTFVECKRSSDTRGRREVVAQMLDYAANGTEYWPMERLRQAAAEAAEDADGALDGQIRRLLQMDDNPDGSAIQGFWQAVEQNLRAHKVHLIFVTDETPRELRRLIEFLNAEMANVEVLAVEVKQFARQDQQALVPRVVGLTEDARSAKLPVMPRGRTTLAEVQAKCPPPAGEFIGRMAGLAQKRGHRIDPGTTGFSVRARLPKAGRMASFAFGWPTGHVGIYFGEIPEQEGHDLRTRLEGLGIFRASGAKTLKVLVTDDNVDCVSEAYALVLDEMDKIVAAY